MIIEILQYVAGMLVMLGAVFALLAAIGLMRLPDLLSRMHAASKAGVVGAGLILLAIALVAFDFGIALRAMFGVIFLVLTTPISAHLLARAAAKTDVVDFVRTNDSVETKITKS